MNKIQIILRNNPISDMHFFLYLLFMVFIFACCDDDKKELFISSPSSKILIENFEGSTHKRWVIEGNAFSLDLVETSLLNSWGDIGFEGSHIITSYINGDEGIGSITSPVFTIGKNHIVFLISGGGDFKKCYVALFVEGEEVKREAGSNSRIMRQIAWDVSEYKDKNAYLKLVDNSTSAWGFINADYFYQTDEVPSGQSTGKFLIDKKYLNFPVDVNAKIGNLMIMKDDTNVYDIDIRLADKAPDYWVHLNCEEWIGKEIEIFIPTNQFLSAIGYSNGKGLSLIYQSDEPREKPTFYQESLRPQIHFTSVRGWLNDPNGLFWKDGLWHLYYQHNPFGTDWGNIHWGHAVSPDLTHWTEYDDVLKPDSLGAMFSGYAIIDENNTLGFQQGSNKTVVVYYTAAGEYNYVSRERPFTQCMAYSIDNGFTWKKYANNPILEEVVFQNRDPHVVWSPEDNYWVMVLFLKNNQFGFFTSTDLIYWTQTSIFEIPNDFECPDFFRIKVENTSNEYKWVLMGVQNFYYVGDFKNGVFTPTSSLQKQDSGINGWYAAAHTFANAPNNRHVQIGCMAGSTFPSLPFDQIMSFPKDIKLYKTNSGYKLHALPVYEIKYLYENTTTYEDLLLTDETISASGKAFHLRGEFDVIASDASYFGFEVDGVRLLYYPQSENIIAIGPGLQTLAIENITPVNGIVSLDVILDTGIIEFFINNGEYSASQCYFTYNIDKTVLFCKEDNSNVKVKTLQITNLKSMW